MQTTDTQTIHLHFVTASRGLQEYLQFSSKRGQQKYHT